VRTISCDYDDGVLILRGRVSAYYLKQVAQAAVAELDGVLKIANHIEVVRPAKRLCHASHDGPAAFSSRDITGGGDRP
jgi:osmotically-inducible protein OsmY